jgi:hypothetical protein
MPKSVQRWATNMSNSSKEPSSSSSSIRSRAVSLPLACCAAIRASPPPSRAARAEYMAQVRPTGLQISAAELKTIQEASTVFMLFSVWYLHEPLAWNHPRRLRLHRAGGLLRVPPLGLSGSGQARRGRPTTPPPAERWPPAAGPVPRPTTPPHIVTLVLLAGISALNMNIFLPSLPNDDGLFRHRLPADAAVGVALSAVNGRAADRASARSRTGSGAGR